MLRPGERPLGGLGLADELTVQVARLMPDVFVDLGANRGDFCRLLRSIGFAGEIVAVEPDPRCSEALQVLADTDARLRVVQAPVTPTGGPVTLNLAQSSLASSVLAPRDAFASAWAGARTVERVDTMSVTLRSIVSELPAPYDIAVKIDIQGLDLAVLAASRPDWHRLVLVLVEVSHEPLYDQEPTHADLLENLADAGLVPIATFPVCWTLNDEPAQSDVLLARQP